MKPVEVQRTLIESSKMSQGMFGLSSNAKDQAHILNILRNRLYTNKILAVLREYTTNGIDAHISVGLNKPIRVQLPTVLDPHLLIRDYGPGLAEEDIYGIYTQYGASTKRETNEQIGMLGIGAKSAFAYSDSFVVTSYNNGKKSVYVASLDETNVGQMAKQWEGPTEESGIEVRIPVKVTDVEQFKREAHKLFRFYDPVPTVNYSIQALEKPEILTEFGYFLGKRKFTETHNANTWIGKVGVVPYNITMGSIAIPEELVHFSQEFLGCLYFNIGEVDIAANREELEYTTKTITAVINKLTGVLESTKKDLVSSIEAIPRGIQRLRKINNYYSTGLLEKAIFGNVVVDYLQDIHLEKRVYSYKHSDELERAERTTPFTISTKRLSRKWVETPTIDWKSKRCLLLEDLNIKPTLRNRYRKLGDYYLVVPDKGIPIDRVESALKARLKELGLEGIEVFRASQVDLNYTPPPPRVYVRRPKNVSTGLLCWKCGVGWVDLPRIMTYSDVIMRCDTEPELSVLLKVNPFLDLPTFVTCKKSYKGPVIGVPFQDWLANTIAMGEGIDWYIQQAIRKNSGVLCETSDLDKLEKALGEDHPLVMALDSGQTEDHGLSIFLRDHIRFPKTYYEYVSELYPLLYTRGTFIDIVRTRTKDLIRYAQLIDKYGA